MSSAGPIGKSSNKAHAAEPDTIPAARPAVEKLKRLAEKFQLQDIAKLIESWEEAAGQPDTLGVAVFGRFKAGKSSFLNRLVEKQYLPTGAVPVTGVITMLRYGESPTCIVRTRNGQVLHPPLEEIPRYITEQENPGNSLDVEFVELHVPELARFPDLVFIDTPGLASVWEHNTKATLSWLPRVEVGLLCVSADAPLAHDDLELLRKLQHLTPHVVLLITKADLLDAAEREQVSRFVTDRLRAASLDHVRWFFFSIKPDHAALVDRLSAELLRPLQQQASLLRSHSALFKLRAATQGLLEHVRLVRAIHDQADEVCSRLHQVLTNAEHQLAQIRVQMILHIQDWSGKVIDIVLEALSEEQMQFRCQIRQELREWLASRRRFPIRSLLEAYKRWLADRIREWLETSVRPRISRSLLQFVGDIQTDLERQVRGFTTVQAEEIQNLLGVKLTQPELSWQPPELVPAPVDVSTEFILPFEALSFVVPSLILRPLLFRSLQRKVEYEVVKNLSRYVAAWRERLLPVLEGLVEQAIGFARWQTARIRQAIATKNQELAELNRLELFLQDQLQVLEHMPSASAPPHVPAKA